MTQWRGLSHRTAASRLGSEWVLMRSALAAAVAVSAYFASITGWRAATLVWLLAPVLIASVFFDTDPSSRLVACRVISGVIGLSALMFEPLGLLYLVPSAFLLGASLTQSRRAISDSAR